MPKSNFLFLDSNHNSELDLSSHSELNILCIPSLENTDIRISTKITNSSHSIINLVIVSNKNVKVDIESYLVSSNSISNINIFAIALDSAAINVNLNSIVPKDNTNSKVNQKIKGILLSDDSHIVGYPNLKIDSNDVVATHALSIGGINKEEEFFLLSKGFSLFQTKQLIINSYINNALSCLEENEYNKYLEIINTLLKKG